MAPVRIARKVALDVRMGVVIAHRVAEQDAHTVVALIARRAAVGRPVVRRRVRRVLLVPGVPRRRAVHPRLMDVIPAAAMAGAVGSPVPVVRKGVNRAPVVPRAVRSMQGARRVADLLPESRSQAAARSGEESVS
jgi:hypothetical protein